MAWNNNKKKLKLISFQNEENFELSREINENKQKTNLNDVFGRTSQFADLILTKNHFFFFMELLKVNWLFFSISHSIYLFNLWANTSLNFCYIKARRKHVMKIYGLLMPRITLWSPCTWRPLLWFMSDFPSQTAFWILNHFSSTCRALHCFSPPSPSCLCLPCFTSRSSCLCLDIPSTKLKNC